MVMCGPQSFGLGISAGDLSHYISSTSLSQKACHAMSRQSDKALTHQQ
jgi:hypothetical protein